MQTNSINNQSFNNNDPLDNEITLWLDHGYNLGATHAVLYFDTHEQSRAMGYVFAPANLEEKISSVKSAGGTIINCWEYARS